MHYIVTGGAGFIGSHITRTLVERGHEVTVIDNFSSGKRENTRGLLSMGQVTLVEGSITDLDLLKGNFEGVDGVFHEAAIISVPWSVEHPQESAAVNVMGTLNVLVAARDCGVKKVVVASSSAVYGDNPELPKREDMLPEPMSPYALSKMTGEYLGAVFSRSYGLAFVALRYFNVYGPGQDPASAYAAVIPKFITRILNGQVPLVYGDGSQTRDFIYVADVVKANLCAMEKSVEGIFNVASGERTSVNELARLVPELMDVTVRPTYEQPRKGDILHSYADISRMKHELFMPDISLRTGLKETVAWYRNNPG
ncbi:MAG: SDR family oxidoreductase [Methanomicrobiales archaeon]|nr:SDR family oxidoreductase [Methanomicrobiales archaeon]